MIADCLLVKVMRLHRSSSDNELFYMPCADMNDLIDILQGSFDKEEFCIGHQRAMAFVEIWIDDGIGNPCFIFDREKDKAVSSTRALTCNHAAGNTCGHAVDEMSQISCRCNSHSLQTLPAVCHGMTAPP